MIYLGITGTIFLLEMVVKTIIEKKGKMGVTKPICGGKILLKKFHNKGFALNFGEKQQRVVAYISLVVCICLTGISLLFGSGWNGMIKTGLSMVLGGAFSNTYDRLFRKYVVDYFSFGVKNKRLQRIVFNLADIFIIIGAIVVMIGGIYHENIGKR